MALPETARTVEAASRPLLTQILTRDLWIVAACLAALCALAWWWLWRMASIPMIAPAPGNMGMAAMPMGPSTDVWSAAYLGPTFAMWAIMMVAMMLPSASPMILLHAAFARRAGSSVDGATLVFALTYVVLWTGFAALAALGQALLVSQGIVAEATLRLGDRTLAAALLALTALYQLSGLKRLCLARCQSPVSFLMRQWRPGPAGAARMGIAHGLYCIGCCGLLMLLLFAGGVMNIAWVAIIALVVLAEKYMPPRLHANWIISGLLLAGSVALFLG